MKNSLNHKRMAELLKDRCEYRRVLIQRKDELETKIKKIEAEIEQLRASA